MFFVAAIINNDGDYNVCYLQINGQDVKDREEAMAALFNDESRNIVLLVARPDMQVRNPHQILRNSHEGFSPKVCLLRANHFTLGLPTIPPSSHCKDI